MSELLKDFYQEKLAEVHSPPSPEITVGSVALEKVAAVLPFPDVSAATAQRPRKGKKPGHAYNEDSTGVYLNKIGQRQLLDGRQEEVELMQTIEAGRNAQQKLETQVDELSRRQRVQLKRQATEGEIAREKFLTANLKLVVSLARRFPRINGMTLDDLIQEGNLGLDHAIDKFDYRKGFKFSTYASFWIRQHIGRALDNNFLIHLPWDKGGELRKALKEADGDEEGIEDPEMYKLYLLSTPTSLQHPLDAQGEGELEDVLSDKDVDVADEAITAAYLTPLLQRVEELDERARYIIKAHMGMLDGRPYSYPTIAAKLGVSPNTVRAIWEQARSQLKTELTDTYGQN